MSDSDQTRLVESAIEEGQDAEARGDLVAAAASYRRLADSKNPAVAADGHFRLGVISWRQGRFEAALLAYEQARQFARQAGRRDLEARAENGVGAVHYARGAYTQARASYMIALGLTNDPILRGRFLLNLGVLANIEGDLDRAMEHYLRARALFRDGGDKASEALALHNLEMLYSDRQEWEAADDAAQDALKLLEKLGDRSTIAAVLRDRSEVLAARGDVAGAVRHCQMAIAIFTELGDELGRGESQRLQGRFLTSQGELEAARRSLRDALHIANQFRVKLLEAEVSRELMMLARKCGDGPAAARWRQRALNLFRALGAQRDVADLERSPGDAPPSA